MTLRRLRELAVLFSAAATLTPLLSVGCAADDASIPPPPAMDAGKADSTVEGGQAEGASEGGADVSREAGPDAESEGATH
jgi:hypothetical protein